MWAGKQGWEWYKDTPLGQWQRSRKGWTALEFGENWGKFAFVVPT